MKIKTRNFIPVISLAILFLLITVFSDNALHAQTMHTLADVPDGGGNTNGGGDGSSTETLYIVAGVAIAAIIGYAVYKKSTKEDTVSSTENESLNRLLNSERETLRTKVTNADEILPVNLFFATQKESFAIPARSYSVGVSLRF